MPPTRPLFDRFCEGFDYDSLWDCWVWNKSINPGGYGILWCKERQVMRLAHRVAYELFAGVIPDGLEIDHICRNRRCVNPDHMEPVTRRVNVLRGNSPIQLRERARAKTHCVHGHLYTPETVCMERRNGGTYSRRCKECRKLKLKPLGFPRPRDNETGQWLKIWKS